MEHDTKASASKAGAAWFGVFLSHLGIHSWSDLAAVLAAIYSALLICEWCWKRWKARQ